jgi:hypothetical protein
MFHVVLEKVQFQTDMFGLLADQGVVGVCDRALTVLLDCDCSSDGFVEYLPHKLTKVESFLGGVCRRIVLCLAC